MPRSLRDQSAGAYHHVFIRGNRRADVFRDNEDRCWFLERLLRVESEAGCVHVAHCLMSNHVHLLLRPGAVGISRVLQRVLGPYTQWFNRRHGLVGHVFQGRFGSRAIDSDADLLWVVRYIHRNPVEAGMVSRADLWRWSSHADYLRESPPDYVREGVLRIRGLLAERPEQPPVLYRRLIDRPDGDYLAPLPSEQEGPPVDPPVAQVSPAPRPSLEELRHSVEREFGLDADALQGPGRSPGERSARRAFCRAARNTWRYSLAETATFLGRSPSQVSDLARDEGARSTDDGRAGGSVPDERASGPSEAGLRR